MRGIIKSLSFFIATVMAISMLSFTAVSAERKSTVEVSSESDFRAALERAENGTTIRLTNNITLSESVEIHQSVTIDGKGYTISGAGIDHTNIVGFLVNDGTAVFKDLTFTDFDENINAPYGSVIKIDTGHDTAKVIVENVKVNNFARDAFTFKAGSFSVKDTVIDCAPDADRPKMLTKAFQIGFGNSKVTGTIQDTTIINSSSNYEEWSSAAIEIYDHADVQIIGGSISNTKQGVYLDNYWAGSAAYPSLTGDSSVTINGTQIVAEKYAVILYGREDQTIQAQMRIAAGIFRGKVATVNGGKNSAIIVTGGTFTDLDESLVTIPQGFVAEEQADGSVVVKVKVEAEIPSIDTAKPSEEIQLGVSQETAEVINQEAANLVTDILTGKEPVGVTKEVAQKVTEAAAAGETVTVAIQFDKEKVATEAEETMVSALIGENGSIAQFFDLSVVLKAGQKELGTITQFSAPITFQMAIPEELIQENRTYFIIRIHDEKAEKIPAILNEDNTISFQADSFSIYALGYEDPIPSLEDVPSSEKTEDGTNHSTGEFSNQSALLMVFVGSGLICIIIFVKVSTRKKKTHF